MVAPQWLMALAAGLVAAVYPQSASGFRCGTDLVSKGDYAHEVRAACGAPTAREPVSDPYPASHPPLGERWYYDRGPRRLLRVVHIRNGRVRLIETRGYGVDPPAKEQCRPNAIAEGMTTYHLRHRCGAPAQRRYLGETVAPKHPSHAGIARVPGAGDDGLVEEWVYTFGAGYLDRRVRLRGGVVVDVESLR